MMTCPYCARPATTTIIASPNRVCTEHAAEFWTGLLAYSHARAGVCVKNDRECSCLRCREMAADFKVAAFQRATASNEHAEFAIRLAS